MPGRPLERRLKGEVEQAGGADSMLERIADGETIASIGRSFGVSRPMMSWFLHKLCGHEAIETARREGAGALAEQCLAIADTADHSNDRSSKLKIETRRWLAGRLDPDSYGEQRGPMVEINMGNLHLDALRRIERERRQLEAASQQAVLPA